MLLLQLLVQLKEHLNKKFTMNLVFNFCALEDGSDDCVFYKIKITQLPSYLYELISKSNHHDKTQNFNHIDPYYCRTDIFKYSFSPDTIVKWNKLDPNLKMLILTCVLEILYLKLVDHFKTQFLRFLIH